MIRWIHRNLVAFIALTAFIAMASILVQQNQVVENQRVLIRQLCSDNAELAARKLSALQEKHRR